MSELLEQLGIDQQELIDRVVDRAAQKLLTETTHVYESDTGAEYDDEVATPLGQALNERAQKLIDAKIDEIASAHVLPRVSEMVETLVLQETNQWGEKRGKSVTFIEYLVGRAENYLREEVDHHGKTKAEDRGHYWSKHGTRVSYMVHKHLQYHVETAMKQALENANKSIVGGLEKAVKIALDEVSKKLKVRVDA